MSLLACLLARSIMTTRAARRVRTSDYSDPPKKSVLQATLKKPLVLLLALALLLPSLTTPLQF